MKFYAVRKGRRPGIYTSWDACKSQVNGYKGAQYKSFPTRQQAEEFINPKQIDEEDIDIEVFLDGSFMDGRCGSGILIIDRKNDKQFKFVGAAEDKYTESRNVLGELNAGVEALSLLAMMFMNNRKKIVIRHDYMGVGAHITGEWKPKQPASIEYTHKMKDILNKHFKTCEVEFKHIKAHSGNEYNDTVDQLAKDACSIYWNTLSRDLEPWTSEDLRSNARVIE